MKAKVVSYERFLLNEILRITSGTDLEKDGKTIHKIYLRRRKLQVQTKRRRMQELAVTLASIAQFLGVDFIPHNLSEEDIQRIRNVDKIILFRHAITADYIVLSHW